MDYLFVLLFVLLLTSVFIYQFPAILEGYLVGFTFWLTGFYLSIYASSTPYQEDRLSINKFLSVLFLLLASDGLNLMHSFFKLIPIQPGTSYVFFDNIVSLSDFSVYIICLYTILLIIGNKGSLLVGKFAYLIAWGAVLEIINNGLLFNGRFFYIPLLFLSISTILFYCPRQVIKSLNFLVYLGEISYGIYIVHLPIMFSIGLVDMRNDTLISYLIRLGVLLLVTIAVAHLLEKVIQPKIRDFIHKATFTSSSNLTNNLPKTNRILIKQVDS